MRDRRSYPDLDSKFPQNCFPHDWEGTASNVPLRLQFSSVILSERRIYGFGIARDREGTASAVPFKLHLDAGFSPARASIICSRCHPENYM
jgi:hypothetical protein